MLLLKRCLFIYIDLIIVQLKQSDIDLYSTLLLQCYTPLLKSSSERPIFHWFEEFH